MFVTCHAIAFGGLIRASGSNGQSSLKAGPIQPDKPELGTVIVRRSGGSNMAQIGLPKVDWLADERGTTAFERRTNPRAKVSGQAMAVFSNPSGAGSLTYVSLLDASTAGLGVMSPIPVDVGTSFSIVPETGNFPRAVGTVVRCEKFEESYRLGLATAARRVA